MEFIKHGKKIILTTKKGLSKNDVHYNFGMCTFCGGQCCKYYAGSYIPDDFKQEITAKFILELLKTKKFAIDFWDGDARLSGKDIVNGTKLEDAISKTYFLRPRHKEKEVVQQGTSGRGECVNFIEGKGCTLPEHEKPYQCRKLIPNYNYEKNEPNCDYLPQDKASKQECAIAWIPFQLQLRNALFLYSE